MVRSAYSGTKLGNWGHLALQMPLSMYNSPLVIPSPLLPHMTHSHFIISPSKEAISTVFGNFPISSQSFPSRQ